MKKKSDLRIQFQFEDKDLFNFPKKVEIRNQNLKLLDSSWLQSNVYEKTSLEPGLYVISLNFASGNKQEKVIEIFPDKNEEIKFQIDDIGPENYRKTKYVGQESKGPISITKSFEVESLGPALGMVLHADYALWKIQNGEWHPVRSSSSLEIKPKENSTEIRLTLLDATRYMLEIKGGNRKNRYICLPRYSNLTCEVELAQGPEKFVYPLDVKIKTENTLAESVLSLLNSGSIDEAKQLLPAEQAEGLLYEKMEDPTAAAIGGYYLLKLEDFGRMHNWAANLANRFPWLPDGSIIYAWQLLKEGRKNSRVDVESVRERILEAYYRGLPIYTEGMRLLHEGLTLLFSHYSNELKENDEEITAAVDKIKSYVSVIDWTEPTTTFTGRSPVDPY